MVDLGGSFGSGTRRSQTFIRKLEHPLVRDRGVAETTFYLYYYGVPQQYFKFSPLPILYQDFLHFSLYLWSMPYSFFAVAFTVKRLRLGGPGVHFLEKSSSVPVRLG